MRICLETGSHSKPENVALPKVQFKFETEISMEQNRPRLSELTPQPCVSQHAHSPSPMFFCFPLLSSQLRLWQAVKKGTREMEVL